MTRLEKIIAFSVIGCMVIFALIYVKQGIVEKVTISQNHYYYYVNNTAVSSKNKEERTINTEYLVFDKETTSKEDGVTTHNIYYTTKDNVEFVKDYAYINMEIVNLDSALHPRLVGTSPPRYYYTTDYYAYTLIYDMNHQEIAREEITLTPNEYNTFQSDTTKREHTEIADALKKGDKHYPVFLADKKIEETQSTQGGNSLEK